MPDVKVSGLPLLSPGSLDAAADFLLVSDASVSLSKKIKPSGLISAAAASAHTVWNFAAGSLDASVTFTRASTGWRFNSSGVLVAETTDAPRFQYDPVTLLPRGLLVESAATNIMVRSTEFDNASWTKIRSSVTANATTAPDGMATADRLVEDVTVNNTHDVRQTAAYVSGTRYCHSIFAKADARSYVFMMLHASAFTSTLTTWFDLSGGTVGTTGAGCTAFIENVGGGWYRCSVIATATATSSQSWIVGTATADNVAYYTGDGVSGLYLWGAELKTGSFVNTYVQTTTAAVTRAAETALITNSLVLTDRCWIIKGRTPRRVDDGTTPTIFQIDNGTEDQRLAVRYVAANTLNVLSTAGGATQCNLASAVVAVDTDFVIAVRWGTDDFALSLNGAAVLTDTSGNLPSGLTTARIGRGQSGNYWNSTIKSIETRRTATNAELQLLSA